MLEAWNFCNRAGPPFTGDPSLPSPRYADCVGNRFDTINCTFGPNEDNCISMELNNAAPNDTSQDDAFAVNKEGELGSKCQINDTYFWTAMLKNGNYISSSNLCQCPYPPQASSISHKSSLKANNLPMNQPLVIHKYTDLSYNGYFEGTWDLNASKDLINPNSNISYFKFEWGVAENGDPVLRNTIKTSKNYPWLMLYTGVDVAYGEKGGVQYIGRGMMKYALPTDIDAIIQYDLKINIADNAASHSSFYFLNMGACWKHNNNGLKDVQCDGNTTTDVTRYVLMETNPNYHVSCTKDHPFSCPRYHTFINGTVVDRNNSGYPYDAYQEWCAPWNC